MQTAFSDRTGRTINVGDTLKWVREPSYYQAGPKKGKLKQEGAEFMAGKVIELPKDVADLNGIKYWCKALGANVNAHPFSGLPSGLNFSKMLQYIEVIS